MLIYLFGNLNRLRDATAEQENELNYKIKTLEQENYELDEIKRKFTLSRSDAMNIYSHSFSTSSI
jgi:hypothetical protein